MDPKALAEEIRSTCPSDNTADGKRGEPDDHRQRQDRFALDLAKSRFHVNDLKCVSAEPLFLADCLKGSEDLLVLGHRRFDV